jgi:hypothetical protein
MAQKEKRKDTMPLIEGGEERVETNEVPVPRVIDASGVEKEQFGHTDCADMEGQTVETPQGDVTFKEVVTGQFLGEDVKKVVATRDSNENTLKVGEHANLYNDWDDREFLIERIEGVHGKNADGRPERITAGFLDIAEDYAARRIGEIDLPDHGGLKQWMHEYRVATIQSIRYRVPLKVDIKVGVRFYFESCLDHIRHRKDKLASEQMLGVITAQEYQNTRMLLELAEGAYRKFLAGEIVL